MNTLILDCSAGMNIHLLCEEKIYSHCDYNQKKHTDELLLAVDKVLNEANISVKEIDKICVCIGPGSFTGIRVAVSIAKGLSIGTGARIYTCSNFDIYSYKNHKNIIYILEGFSTNVYVRIDDDNQKDFCVDINSFIDEIKSKYKDYKILVQSEKLQNSLKNSEILSKIAENNIILYFKDKIQTDNYTIINQISPIYLRASQAELEREEKIKKGLINDDK